MRIRSIRPEFWSSEDVAAMDWPTRLIYIGLWSYVDDNGVGRDNPKLIRADLFPLEDDPHGVLMQIAGALKHLETGGQITRYSVDGKPYLHIAAWETHQKINRPTEGRYPLPTCANAVLHDTLTEDSVSPHANVPLGEGEKGRRGEGEKPSSASADAERESDRDFAEFWLAYPRKKAKPDGTKAYKAARKRVSHQVIMECLARDMATTWAKRSPEHVPYPASWLRDDPWDDETDATLAATGTPFPENGTQDEKDAWVRAQPRPEWAGYR